MRIVKLAEDGHTHVFPREDSALLAAYPIRFRSFPDGLVVTAADPEHAAARRQRGRRAGRKVKTSPLVFAGDNGHARPVPRDHLAMAAVLTRADTRPEGRHGFVGPRTEAGKASSARAASSRCSGRRGARPSPGAAGRAGASRSAWKRA